MDPQAAGSGGERSRSPTLDDLTRLCRRLNEVGAAYLVVGGWAMVHHGAIRTTEDIDLLIEASPQNQAKVRTALEMLPDKAVRLVEPGDLEKYVVVRVADDILVDLMLAACGLRYEDAAAGIVRVDVDGVTIPIPAADILLRMKQTHREKDFEDRLFLQDLVRALDRERPGP